MFIFFLIYARTTYEYRVLHKSQQQLRYGALWQEQKHYTNYTLTVGSLENKKPEDTLSCSVSFVTFWSPLHSTRNHVSVALHGKGGDRFENSFEELIDEINTNKAFHLNKHSNSLYYQFLYNPPDVEKTISLLQKLSPETIRLIMPDILEHFFKKKLY